MSEVTPCTELPRSTLQTRWKKDGTRSVKASHSPVGAQACCIQVIIGDLSSAAPLKARTHTGSLSKHQTATERRGAGASQRHVLRSIVRMRGCCAHAFIYLCKRPSFSLSFPSPLPPIPYLCFPLWDKVMREWGKPNKCRSTSFSTYYHAVDIHYCASLMPYTCRCHTFGKGFSKNKLYNYIISNLSVMCSKMTPLS